MTRAGLLAIVVALVPTPAAACAACLTSAYGDRSFNWAFAALMLMPFAVAAGFGVVLLILAGGVGGSLPDLFQRWRRLARRPKPERQVV
ncbi:MAG: hypothetical protein HY216_08060 [Candidatus Rokubacteria bacterium]|nr:hypothetical protein [Candidatus Rokubacteria bacterium]